MANIELFTFSAIALMTIPRAPIGISTVSSVRTQQETSREMLSKDITVTHLQGNHQEPFRQMYLRFFYSKYF